MKLRRLLQVGLTIFYGQLLSIGIYDYILMVVPAFIKNPSSYSNIVFVMFGVFIILTSVLSLIAIWKKAFKLIFVSGVFLIIIFTIFIVFNTIALIYYYNNMSIVFKYHFISVFVIKSFLIILAVFVTFYMVFRSSYTSVPNREP